MKARMLVATVQPAEDGSRLVLAPAVGVWSDVPAPGTLLAPGAGIGTLRQLNRRSSLRLPPDVGGEVRGGPLGLRALPVGYGEPLFSLVPFARAATPADGAACLPADTDPDAQQWAVIAPTDGVFYNRPAPDAAPYVELGSRIRSGEPVGLIEVMKTFNQIPYDIPGAPETAVVVEIRCTDRSEVQAGATLIVVRDPSSQDGSPG